MSNIAATFSVGYGATEIVGSIMLIMMGGWLSYHRGGFAWRSEPKLEFNWHPLLMTIGLLFLNGNAMLIYRAFRNHRKRSLKLAHAALNVASFVCVVIGLVAVFDSHNLSKPPIQNLYTLHSWLGIFTVFIFVCQWIGGFVSFLYPTLTPSIRADYMPVHVFFGMFIFALSSAICLLGMTEKAFFSVHDYSKFSSEGLYLNVIGIIIIIFTALVLLMVGPEKFKRQPLPEDEMLLATHKCASVPHHHEHHQTHKGRQNEDSPFPTVFGLKKLPNLRLVERWKEEPPKQIDLVEVQ